jgi:hypothetical protein
VSSFKFAPYTSSYESSAVVLDKHGVLDQIRVSSRPQPVAFVSSARSSFAVQSRAPIPKQLSLAKSNALKPKQSGGYSSLSPQTDGDPKSSAFPHLSIQKNASAFELTGSVSCSVCCVLH